MEEGVGSSRSFSLHPRSPGEGGDAEAGLLMNWQGSRVDLKVTWDDLENETKRPRERSKQTPAPLDLRTIGKLNTFGDLPTMI